MARTKVHKDGTKTFAELTLIEQKKSINMAILNLKRSIKANKKKSDSEGQPDLTREYIKNVLGMLCDLLGKDKQG
jgi:hypothetical protein